MLCAIYYYLYNLKNVKNTHGGVILLVTLLKVTLFHGCSSCFLNCTNGAKLREALQNKYGQSLQTSILCKVDKFKLALP